MQFEQAEPEHRPQGNRARRVLRLARSVCSAFFALAACAATSAFAAESDVHFGLTRFLALQAGFEPGQAEQIAIGNQRVDSGDMQYIALLFDYACLGRDTELASEVSARHYPTGGRLPGPPEQRAVAAGSEFAWKEAREMQGTRPDQANFMLQRLGHALHVLQESYFHHGVPDTPQFGSLFACDATLAWAHPRARGGWRSHAADLTARWPGETVQMAKATYDALVGYPPVGPAARKPKPWEQVRAALDGFVKASTKAEKQAWFVAQGITDVSFLGGISLRDGARPFDLEWGSRRLPKLPALQSRQHETDGSLLDFYNRFFSQWLTTEDFDRLAAENAAPAGSAAGKGGGAVDKVELAARLRLWRIRDHGAVADLAHSPQKLTRRQLGVLAGLARSPAALARYANPADAVFPLITNTKAASPLLPFIVRSAPRAPTGNDRAVAIVKLRHLPYDTIGVVAESIDGTWRVIAITAVVDH